MSSAASTISMKRDAPIPTWFGVGGRADLYAEPANIEELAEISTTHAPVRILGDGANLLVDDEGVDGVVISLTRMNSWRTLDEHGRIEADAGVNLPKLLIETARDGLAGLEGLAGIPATLGGALRMNAGGAFGEIADVVQNVRVMDRDGRISQRNRKDIPFKYRASGLEDVIILGAELKLTPEPTDAVRTRLKHAMQHKKNSQPLADKSAGCVFKNPIVDGERTSAGRIIDESGCKGLTVGGARVSEVHANFIVTETGCRAQDIIELLACVANIVREKTGVELEREVVIWRRGETS